MQDWVEGALRGRWPDWSFEETIKAKLLFLEYLGVAFSEREAEEGQRLAEHLEAFGGEEQATLFAGSRMIPAPQAALANAALTDASLLFPVALAAIEQLNKGGQELLASLIVGLEASYRMEEHAEAELLGALLAAAHAFELDEDGLSVLVGLITQHHNGIPERSMGRGLLAHDLVLQAGLARDDWSEAAVEKRGLPFDWLEALQRTADKPGMNTFLMALEVNADQVIAAFRERVAGKLPPAHIEYYVDAVMGLEDICCIPLFFRR